VPVDRWFEARVSPSETGAPPLLLIVLRDLTEAQRVERMRVDFIANVSHELRTPLASLLGFIETLQGAARNDRESRERFLDIMVQQARRMARLIDDLISLSRIELKAHVRPARRGPCFDPPPRRRHHGAHRARKRVDLNLDISASPLLVRGDHDELAQLFQNLMHNAIKYGHGGGRLDVSASRQPRPSGKPERISVAVRDYGPGIAEEHLPRLTERFYRVDVATSRDKGGTGLGLAIVKHILNRHRGHCPSTVRRTRERPSRFTSTRSPASRKRARHERAYRCGLRRGVGRTGGPGCPDGRPGREGADEAVLALDRADEDRARRVIEADGRVDDLERDIEERAVRMIAGASRWPAISGRS
jgi:signal transduction histidine kinase